MEKNNKNLNVPNLRFPEFSGEWELVRLGDVCKFFSGGTPSSTNKDFYGRKRANTMQLRKPGQKIIMVEVARQTSGSGVANTRYYWSKKNVFPHNRMANVAFWDGHSEMLKEQGPYFFRSTNSDGTNGLTSKNSAAAKPHWDYAYPTPK